MTNKWMFGVAIFVIMSMIVYSGLLFDDSVPENTDHIYINNIGTEWANYSNGFYGYNFDFKINNLSSNHNIQIIVSFYDLNGSLVKNENLEGGINEPISKGEVEDNLTINLRESQKSYSDFPVHIWDGISNMKYYELDHIKIDILDISENKLLYSINQTFNMSNLYDPNDLVIDEEETDDLDDSNSETSKSDSDYEFFKYTDYNGDGLVNFNEFSEISYIFTEDSFWDGYSTEEILQSEWDSADVDGDGYLTFDEFKNVT